MQKSETGIDFVPANFNLQLDSKRRTCHLVVSIPNRGETVLPKMNLRFYRGDPNQNLDEVGNTHHGWHSAGPIEPGETWNERTADFHLADGQYEFNAMLDYDNTVVETDETNNTISLQIKIVNDQIGEKNVSLRPGHKTDVKIETQKPEAGSQGADMWKTLCES